MYSAVNTRVKNFKKPLHKEPSKPNPTLIVGDLVLMHRYRSQPPDCESRYRDTVVQANQNQKLKLSTGRVVSSGGATWWERSPDCESRHGAYSYHWGNCAWHGGYTPQCNQGVKTTKRPLLEVPYMGMSEVSGPTVNPGTGTPW